MKLVLQDCLPIADTPRICKHLAALSFTPKTSHCISCGPKHRMVNLDFLFPPARLHFHHPAQSRCLQPSAVAYVGRRASQTSECFPYTLCVCLCVCVWVCCVMKRRQTSTRCCQRQSVQMMILRHKIRQTRLEVSPEKSANHI